MGSTKPSERAAAVTSAERESARVAVNEGLAAARALASASTDLERLAFARTMAFAAVGAYRECALSDDNRGWGFVDLPATVTLSRLSSSAARIARSIGSAAATFDVAEAGYLVGAVYTATMPTRARAEFGAYYTPPALCERLLDMATQAGVDWRVARVLDPACGGGAFLSPVALRMAKSLRDSSPKIAFRNILQRLRGFEIDPFAAWLSEAFLGVALSDLCRAAGTRLPRVVEVGDSLARDAGPDRFDLVVGNPPYGRATLSSELREKYRRSLYGHANLYGVFTDLALRFVRSGGVIAYVTPTSFLGGEYFKALRGLLGREAPPDSIAFISDRKGVFADVLQETVLAVYRRGGSPGSTRVHFISPTARGGIEAVATGSFRLPDQPVDPWLAPRATSHGDLVRAARRMSHRLVDYGYAVKTGPLVWNRHKEGLRDRPGKGRFPLIWAESVRSDGSFEFRAERRSHAPYFEPQRSEGWVITNFPCVLVQRTTAKEQARRLIAAEMPASFVATHGAVVVENHLNMIHPINDSPLVSPAALAALLNTAVVDDLFRCINGSVAVSAYELEALPLPAPQTLVELEDLTRSRAETSAAERVASRLYRERVW